MALPTPLKILLQDQVLIIIEDALSVSRKNVRDYDLSVVRNVLPNGYVVIKPSNITPAPPSVTDTIHLQAAGAPAAATLVNTTDDTFEARAFLDDIVAAVQPRPVEKIRTKIEFWDGEDVGRAMTLTATLTSGNATIVVPDNTLLTPGQPISGTGIPPGAIIFSVPIDSLTTVILSHKATSNGDQEVTLGGSNYLGGYFEDEAMGEGKDAIILQ